MAEAEPHSFLLALGRDYDRGHLIGEHAMAYSPEEASRQPTISDVKRDVERLRDELAEVIALVRFLTAHRSAAYDLRTLRDDVLAIAEDCLDDLRLRIQERPLQSVALTAGAGILLSLLVKR
ncbi:hypothetical protein ACLBXM_06655 [Xanthobacteraceae bacterium A53D]